MTGRRYESGFEIITDCTKEILGIYNSFCGILNNAISANTSVNDTVKGMGDLHENAAVNATSATSNSTGISDSELLDKARASKGGAKFEALWRGDCNGYKSQIGRASCRERV